MASLVRIYCTRTCPYCQMALRLLEHKGVEIEKIAVDRDPELRAHMTEITGQTTVPQIFIGTRHIGGYSELSALDRAGQLDPLLRPA